MAVIRNPKDFGAGILYIAFGAVGYYIARDYGMGQASRMGPGYFPTVLSVIADGIRARRRHPFLPARTASRSALSPGRRPLSWSDRPRCSASC